MKETYGVPVEEIQEGIKHGVRKINIDTDIRLAMTGAIRRYLVENPSQVRSARLPEAGARSGDEVCKARYLAFGCEGQAGKIKPIPLEKMAERYKSGELVADRASKLDFLQQIVRATVQGADRSSISGATASAAMPPARFPEISMTTSLLSNPPSPPCRCSAAARSATTTPSATTRS